MKGQTGSAPPNKSAVGRASRNERRRLPRVKISKTVLICPYDAKLGEEVQPTLNASPTGAYFATRAKHYYIGMTLLIAPTDGQGRICGSDYVSEVRRIDHLPDGRLGIAVRFLGGDAALIGSMSGTRHPSGENA